MADQEQRKQMKEIGTSLHARYHVYCEPIVYITHVLRFQVPLEDSPYDCGTCLLANMLSVAYNLPLFDYPAIAQLRSHFALQLMRTNLFLPEYEHLSLLAAVSTPRRKSMPVTSASQSSARDCSAAERLLKVKDTRFDRDVQVQEYCREAS